MRDRRELFISTVTPVVATVLVAIAMVAVGVRNLGGSPPAAAPQPVVAGQATSLVVAAPAATTKADDSGLAPDAVAAADQVRAGGVRYGIAILDRKSGVTSVGRDGAAGFYAASVVKLYVAVDLLHQSEHGAITLGAAARTDIRQVLEVSDDADMDKLWSAFDGPTLVTQLVGLAGLRDTRLDTGDTGKWARTRTSARDVLAVYQYALTKLSATDTTTLLGYLHNAADTAADGFDEAFGLLAPPRPATVKAKQGWLTTGSTTELNTTGVLGSDNRFVIAILTEQPVTVDAATGRANADKASTIILRTLAPAVS